MASPLDLLVPEQLPEAARSAMEPARLGLIITAVSEAVARYVGYPLHRRLGVVETAVGSGGVYLWLRSGAVRQIHRVEVRGEERDAGTYALESPTLGRLLARGQPWPFTGEWTQGVSPTPLEARDTGELLVTYDAGWGTPGQHVLEESLVVDLPASIQLAAVEVVVATVSRDGKPGDVASENIGATSMSYFAGEDGGRTALPSTARQLLAPYRRPR
ncbi:hypothetical protein HUA74_02685 [Myxococcus sp. CA051A]|uniref:hypothetical protein n=1 Tax=Myxococcus sp. CA051A TaxID=2741739 RepID=UPI00157AF4A9|nr:hypothetical protein [Myxococcus sp. CA051A]NTX59560.1 hypothetical protein [Myxococcus sp. CA051A]